MKLKFIMAAVLIAGMGPGESSPPPEPLSPVNEPVGTADSVVLPNDPQDTLVVAPAELEILTGNLADPADFQWKKRLVVVFADTPNDPSFIEQAAALSARPGQLVDRDVVVIIDTEPQARSVWREMLHPSGFSLVLIDKDGQVKQRKPAPWDVREITRAIDKFPLRRQEVGRRAVDR